MTQCFKGIFTALVTPFKYNNEIDWDSLYKLIDSQIEAGVAGLVVSGTTGESPTLTLEENQKLINETIGRVKGKCMVIAGTGTNSTQTTVQKSVMAKELGVNAVLVVNPYYNKPNQEGLFQHFSTTAKAISPIPLILYDVPGRAVSTLEMATIKRLLKECDNIKGIKDATGDLTRVTQMRRELPLDFTILSGDDPLFYPSLSLGGNGVISVASNIIPKKMVDLYDLYQKKEIANALRIHSEVFPLLTGMFIDTNPIPVKWAAHRMELISTPTLRLPLCGPSTSTKKRLNYLLDEIITEVNK